MASLAMVLNSLRSSPDLQLIQLEVFSFPLLVIGEATCQWLREARTLSDEMLSVSVEEGYNVCHPQHTTRTFLGPDWKIEVHLKKAEFCRD